MPSEKLGALLSIVSNYKLDDRATGVRSPAERKDFPFSLCIQNSSKAQGSFSGGKVGQGRDADHSPHPVPKSWMSGSNTSLSLGAGMVVAGQLHFFTFTCVML
jgi:hypothetical protein